MSGPFALSSESSRPEPSAITIATPTNATASPTTRLVVTRSSPRANARIIVSPGASATTSAAIPEVV